VAAGEAEVGQTFCVDIHQTDVCRCSLSACSLENIRVRVCWCKAGSQQHIYTRTHAYSHVRTVLGSELVLRSALLRCWCASVCVCVTVCVCLCVVSGYRGGRGGGGGYGGGGGGGRYDDRYVSLHAALAPRSTCTAERLRCMKTHAVVCAGSASAAADAPPKLVCVRARKSNTALALRCVLGVARGSGYGGGGGGGGGGRYGGGGGGYNDRPRYDDRYSGGDRRNDDRGGGGRRDDDRRYDRDYDRGGDRRGRDDDRGGGGGGGGGPPRERSRSGRSVASIIIYFFYRNVRWRRQRYSCLCCTARYTRRMWSVADPGAVTSSCVVRAAPIVVRALRSGMPNAKVVVVVAAAAAMRVPHPSRQGAVDLKAHLCARITAPGGL